MRDAAGRRLTYHVEARARLYAHQRQVEEQVRTVMDIVFEEMEGDPVAGSKRRSSPPAIAVGRVQLFLISDRPPDAFPCALKRGLDLVPGMDALEDADVCLSVVERAGHPLFASIDKVPKDSVEAPELRLGRPRQLVVGNDVHKLDEDVVEAAPDGQDVESCGRLVGHHPEVSMVQATDGVEPQEASY